MTRSTGERATVLIAEDEPYSRGLVALELRRHGYQVVEASTGDEAVAVALQTQPDVALLSDWLPEHNGLDVATVLANDPDVGGVQVVLMCARRRPATRGSLTWQGIHMFLYRPFSVDEVVTCVGAALARTGRLRSWTEAAVPAEAPPLLRFAVRQDARQHGYRIWDSVRHQWTRHPAFAAEPAAERLAGVLNSRAALKAQRQGPRVPAA